MLLPRGHPSAVPGEFSYFSDRAFYTDSLYYVLEDHNKTLIKMMDNVGFVLVLGL